MARPPRTNPFRTSRLDALRFRLDAAGWTELMQRLELLGRRGALVGPEGSGKSTLLRELSQRLEADDFHIRRLQLHRDAPPPKAAVWRRLTGALGPRDVLVVDGGDEVPLLRWWWLRRVSRRGGGLLTTLHRPGRLPTLRRHRTSPELLAELVAELSESMASQPSEIELADLFTRHRGNLRDCLLELYDHWGAAE